MKKLKGWLLIVICGILLFCFGITAIVLFEQLINDNESQQNIQQSDWLFWLVLFGFIVMALFGFWRGIKILRKKTEEVLVTYEKLIAISFSGKIDFADYRKTILGLTFKKPKYLIYIFIMLVSLVSYKTTLSTLELDSDVPFLIVLVLLMYPILVVYQIRNNYKTTKVFQEILEYHISNERLHIKGATFEATQKWEHFVKIKETSIYILLYTNKMVATFVDKRLFKEKELIEFKKFLCSMDVDKELK